MANDTNVNVNISATTDDLQSGMARASSIVESSSAQMQASMSAMGETADQAAARIKAMVQASLAEQAASPAIAQSERAVAESMGLRTAATVAQTEALKASIAAQTAQMVPIAEYIGAQEAATAATVEATAANTAFAISSRTAYSASALITDLMTGQYGRVQREVAALSNETGLMSKAFSALLGPVGAVLAVAALLVGAFVSITVEQGKFSQALESTGNFVGKTVADMEDLKNAIGSANTEYSDASTALVSLAGSGKIAGDSLQSAAQTAVDFAEATGTAIDKSVEEIEKLAANPAKAVAALNEQFHFLTIAEYEQIVALQAAGNQQAAFNEALAATDAAMQKRIAEEQAQAGILSRAWHGAISSIGEDWNTLKNILSGIGQSGVNASLDSELKTLTGLEDALASAKISNQALVPAYEAAIAESKKKVVALEAERNAQVSSNSAASEAAAAQSQFISAMEQVRPKIEQETQSLEAQVVTFGRGQVALLEYEKSQMLLKDTMSLSGQALLDAQKAIDDLFNPAIKAAQALQTLTEQHKAAEKAATEHAKALRDAQSGMLALENEADKLAGSLGGKLAQAQAQHDEDVRKLVEDYAKAIENTANLEQAQELLAKGIANADEKLQEAKDSVVTFSQAMVDLDNKYQHDLDLLTMTTGQRKYATEVERAENTVLREMNTTLDALNKTNPEAVAQIKAQAAAFVQSAEATAQAQKALQEWANIAKSSFDSLTQDIAKNIVEGGSFMSSLKDVAKQTVEAIIAQFLRLEFLGPFMRMIFGEQAAGSLGFAQAGVGLLSGGSFGGSSSILGSVASAFSGGGSSSGGGFSFSDPSSWLSAGKTLWDGFSGGFQSLWGTNPALMGPPTATGQLTSFQPGYTTGWGQALGVAGGLYAGYNEFNAAGGGAGGLAGGLAYGVGTYYAGAAIATSMSAGLAAGMAAIPVVGWVALAAMALNAITGGGLFGTAWKVNGGSETTTISGTGADVSAVLDESRKKALFGGTAHRQVSTTVDQAAIDAANQFFDALQKGTNDFAAQFGTTLTNIVGGSFTQNFDKNGKPTTTTDTVNGQTFTGDTTQQFMERIQAANYIAVLDQLGVNATEYSKAFINNADDLIKAIQDLGAASLAAYSDINNGMGLLGPDGSLGAVMSEVEKLDQSGEALADAYKRLVTEEDAWKGSMEAAALGMSSASTKTLEFADALTKAFGSASAMQTALQTFDKNYYTPQELAAQQLANDKAQLATLGGAIGQDPTETMAQFKQAFDAVEASLTPDQLAQWINFGNLLAQVTSEVNSAAQAAQTAANNYAQFMAQFQPAASGFEQAMQKVEVSLAQNIAQANALAVANGQAGASAADIGTIISASVMQGVAAVQQLEAEAASLSQTLFQGDLSSQITALQTKLAADQAAYKGGNQFAGLYAQQDQAQLTALQAQLSAQQEAAQKQQQFLQAAQLLGDLGQIGAITGQGLGDFAKMFNIPLDKFATMLGTDQAGLANEFSQQEAMAKSSLEIAANTKYSAQIQADILSVLSGKTPQFSPEDIYSTLTGQPLAQQAIGGKTGPIIGATGPGANGTAATVSPAGTSGDPVVTKNPDTTTAVNNQTPILRDIRNALRDLTTVRDRYYAPRNTRPSMVN